MKLRLRNKYEFLFNLLLLYLHASKIFPAQNRSIHGLKSDFIRRTNKLYQNTQFCIRLYEFELDCCRIYKHNEYIYIEYNESIKKKPCKKFKKMYKIK